MRPYIRRGEGAKVLHKGAREDKYLEVLSKHDLQGGKPWLKGGQLPPLPQKKPLCVCVFVKKSTQNCIQKYNNLAILSIVLAGQFPSHSPNFCVQEVHTQCEFLKEIIGYWNDTSNVSNPIRNFDRFLMMGHYSRAEILLAHFSRNEHTGTAICYTQGTGPLVWFLKWSCPLGGFDFVLH